MDEKKSIVSIFSQNWMTTFVPAILAMTFAGLFFVDSTQEHEGLFRLSEGLAFEGIIQIFIWSCIISVLITVLTSDIWFSKIMLLWRAVVLMFLVIVVTIGFVIAFRWFPLNYWEAWAAFLGLFALGFGGGLVAMVAKTKIKDRRYNKLLSEYKSKRGENLS